MPVIKIRRQVGLGLVAVFLTTAGIAPRGCIMGTPDMAYFDDDFYPVTRITAGVVGEPGRRIFLLQAQVEGQTLTWMLEKRDVAALWKAIPRLLARVRDEYPELGEPLVAANLTWPCANPLTRFSGSAAYRSITTGFTTWWY